MTGEHHAAGADQFGSGVARFDTACDRLLDRFRGTPTADSVMLAASKAGDWSLIWHAIVLIRAVALRRFNDVPRFAALIVLESVIVNQGVKRLFRRERPTVDGHPDLKVRQPSTSSFPSGHASAATVAAAALTHRSPRLAPIWWAIALAVGSSRAFVRIHHVSDVVAGGITGAMIWRLVGRRIVK